MTELADELAQHLAAARQKAAAAGNNLPQILEALDHAASMLKAVTAARRDLAALVKEQVRAAIRHGEDYRDLYGRPYSPPLVKALAVSEGVEVTRRPGPRPQDTDRREPTAANTAAT